MFKKFSAGVVCLLCTWQLVETASAQQTAGPGRLQVSVPANASVYINNRKTNSGGALRRFESPGLLPGKQYVYEIRVVINQPGKKLEQTKRVVLRSNEEKRVVFYSRELTEKNPPGRVVAEKVTEPDKKTPKFTKPHVVLDLDGAINEKSVTFSPDGSCFTTLSKDKPRDLTVWDAATGKKRFTIPNFGSGYPFSRRHAFRRDSQALAFPNGEVVAIYDTQSGEVVAKLAHPGVNIISFSHNADFLFSYHFDRKKHPLLPLTVRMWEARNWTQKLKTRDETVPLLAPAISDDGQYVAAIEAPKKAKPKLRIWEVETGKERTAPELEKGVYAGIPVFLSGSHDLFVPGVTLWDVATGNKKILPKDLKPVASSFSFLIEGAAMKRAAEIEEGKIVVRSADGRVTGRFPHPFNKSNENLRCFDEALVVTKNRDLTERDSVILDPDTGRQMVSLAHEGELVLNSTGEYVANVVRQKPFERDGGGLEIRETRTGFLLARIRYYGGPPYEGQNRIKFAPGGKYLAIAGTNSVELWDISKLVERRKPVPSER